MPINKFEAFNQLKDAITTFLETNRQATIKELSDGLAVGVNSVRNACNVLIDDGIIEVGDRSGKGGSYHYRLTDTVTFPSLYNNRSSQNIDIYSLATTGGLNPALTRAANLTRIGAAELLTAVATSDENKLLALRQDLLTSIQLLDNVVSMLKQFLNHRAIWALSGIAPSSPPVGITNNAARVTPALIEMVSYLTEDEMAAIIKALETFDVASTDRKEQVSVQD